MKRDGESGSPWRTPRLTLKEGVEKPLLKTQLERYWNAIASLSVITKLQKSYKLGYNSSLTNIEFEIILAFHYVKS